MSMSGMSLWPVFAAFLLGAMNAGSAVLQMTTGLSKYLVQVLQFLIVLLLAARLAADGLQRRRKATV